MQLTAMFGENAALSGLKSIATAQNLPGIRCGKGFRPAKGCQQLFICGV